MSDKPKAFPFPPMFYIVGIIIGYFVNTWFELSFSSFAIARGILSTLIVTAAVYIGASAILLFKQTKNEIRPDSPVRSIVAKGPYRFSRNPMYLAWSLFQLGVGLALGNIWVLVLLPVAMILTQISAIKPEEMYLTKKFGASYKKYFRDVRRWI